jgi:hypothetical protein
MYSFSVTELDTGIKVAAGRCDSLEATRREAAHYGLQYAYDGPVRVVIRNGRKVVSTTVLREESE